jgi:predicted DCC family thiol-disulfide oxidoreductase YuxK
MPVILFDGVCNLCNASVLFIIDRDPRGHFAFAPLQSEYAAALLREHGRQGDALATVLLIEDGRVYDRSSAALRIARRLSGLWPLLSVFRIVPRPLRDLAYDRLARHRYRWFGRTEACRVPTPDLRNRFLA